jgi:Tol biopolymer transport system component
MPGEKETIMRHLALVAAAVSMTLACSATPRVTPLATYSGTETAPSLSPDGTRFAFVWDGERGDNRDIYVTRLSGGAPFRLTSDAAEDHFPVWSPDGSWIAFRRSTEVGQAIYVIPSDGGVERKLMDLQGIGTGASWSPDGKWLAVGELLSGIFLIPFGEGGGERTQLISQETPFYHAAPVFSPDGRFLAFVTGASAGAEDIHLLELNHDYSAKGTPRRVTHHGGFLRGISWTGDGRTLAYSHSVDPLSNAWLWRVHPFDGGERERLDFAGPQATWPTVARKGNRLVYRSGRNGVDIWRLEAGEAWEESLFTQLWDKHPRFSFDGQKLTFSSRREGGQSAIWVSNADGSSPRRITTASERAQDYPSWSPDGRSVAFHAPGEGGAHDVFVVDVAGGEVRQLTRHPGDDQQPSWSRDGQWIYFQSKRSGRWEVMRVPAGGGEAVQVTDNGGYRPVLSHDGRTLFYVRPGTGQGPLFARPVAGGPERMVLESVRWCFWVVEGGIYYFATPGEDGSLPLRYHDFASGSNRLLTIVTGELGEDLTASPDGRTVLLQAGSPTKYELMLVEHF